MKKKTLTPEDLLEEIQRRQLSRIQSVRSSAVMLREVCDSLIKKIDNEGLNGYFSINSECRRHAIALHKNCLELCMFRGWYQELSAYVQEKSEDGIIKGNQETREEDE